MTELDDHKNMLSADEQATLVEALMAIRSKVCWKPGKDVVHHQKRQNMGHLPASCSLAGYEEYLTTRGFVLLGRVEEVLRWTKEAHT